MKHLSMVVRGIGCRWSGLGVGCALLSVFLVSGCSGKYVTGLEESGSGGLNGTGGDAASGGLSATGGMDGGTGGDASTGGGEPYVEPECPDEEPPEPYSECDPLDPYADCQAGFGCYPFLEYPFGEGCGHPMFGSFCAPEDVGVQGDNCDNSNCEPGFMCILGQGGKRCLKICEPIRDHACPDGLICGETDVQGYGVCF